MFRDQALHLPSCLTEILDSECRASGRYCVPLAVAVFELILNQEVSLKA
jgi:hypothetical protein